MICYYIISNVCINAICVKNIWCFYYKNNKTTIIEWWWSIHCYFDFFILYIFKTYLYIYIFIFSLFKLKKEGASSSSSSRCVCQHTCWGAAESAASAADMPAGSCSSLRVSSWGALSSLPCSPSVLLSIVPEGRWTQRPQHHLHY